MRFIQIQLFLYLACKTSTIHQPQFITFEKCGTEQSNSETLTEGVTVIQINKKVSVGETSNVKYLSAFYSGSAITNSDICVKASGSNDELHIGGNNVKIVLFEVSGQKRIIFVGTMTENIFKPYLIGDTEKNEKFVYVETIKCIEVGDVSTYKNSATEPKPFIDGTTHLCFVADLISTSFKVTGTKSSTPFEFIVSKYPKQTCPSCPTLPPPLSTSTDCKSS